MNITMTPDWVEENSRYLMTAVDAVRAVLEDYASKRQERSSIAIPLENTTLTDTTTASPPPALAQLCATFKLSQSDRIILLLCVAMNVVPNFASLCALAQGDPQLCYPTFGLAKEVFSQVSWSSFTTHSPLLRWQLIEIRNGNAPALCHLQIDKSILCYLVGEPCLDEKLEGIVKLISLTNTNTQNLPPSHQKIGSDLTALLSPNTSTSRVTQLQLCSDDVLARRDIAAAACAAVGCNLYAMKAHRLPTALTEIESLLQRWQRQALLSNSILLLECDGVNPELTNGQYASEHFLEKIDTRLIISSRDRINYTSNSPLTFNIPKLTQSEQLAIWQNTLGSLGTELNGQLEAVVSQFNLTSDAIQTACATALERFRQNRTETSTPEPDNFGIVLWNSCCALARPSLEELAQPISSSFTWDDLVLPERQKQILRDIVTHVKQRNKVYSSWGFGKKSGRGLGIAALFSGASGTGKTMAAEIVANKLNLDLYRIDLSSVVSKYIGETEKNLRRIFDAAEMGGAVLLFDEADALFGKRSDVKDSRDRYANIEVNYLLQRIEVYQGLAILTTNLKDSLDSAFLRRIRFIVNFPFPDANQRKEIWQSTFPKDTPTKELNFDRLARLNMAGGNIRNIALNAAFLAADAEESVMMKHLLSATQSEYTKLERLLSDSEVKGWV